MWRSPSGKQQVRSRSEPNGDTLEGHLSGRHLTIVADIAARVKQGPGNQYGLCVHSSSERNLGGRLVRSVLTLLTAAWLARFVIRRFSKATDTFAGSADMWPPVVKADKRTNA
jgi:hypothetical protein